MSTKQFRKQPSSDANNEKKPVSDNKSSPQVKFVTITEKNEFQRIDNFLISLLKGVPKSKIYKVILFL